MVARHTVPLVNEMLFCGTVCRAAVTFIVFK